MQVLKLTRRNTSGVGKQPGKLNEIISSDFTSISTLARFELAPEMNHTAAKSAFGCSACGEAKKIKFTPAELIDLFQGKASEWKDTDQAISINYARNYALANEHEPTQSAE